MKKIIPVVLAICMVLVFAACTASTETTPGQSVETTQSATSEDTASQPETSYQFGFSVPSLEFTYFSTMKTVIEKTYPKDGISVTVYDAGNNQEQQNHDIEDMISAGVDGIVLIPITVEGAAPAIKYANEKAVPVITVDRAVTAETGVDVVSFVGSDHYTMGKQAAELLIAALEAKFPDQETWSVVELEGTAGSSAAIDRGAGMNDRMAEDSRIDIIASLNGEFSTTTATSVAEDVLTAHPDLNAFICHNDMMAEGCYQALVNANMLGKVVIIGIDGQSSTVQKIVDGNIMGTVIQYPDKMALQGIELLAAYLNGETVEDTYYIETESIDSSNAKRFIDEGLAW